MIDEKKLIEDFKNTFSDSILNQTFGFGKYTLLEVFEEMIARQPQVETDTNVGSRREWYQRGYQDGLNADRWIPVEERLPEEENEYYLVCTENKYICTCAWTKKGWNTLKCSDGTYSTENEIKTIIAWQPLPQPYKKEGADDGIS